MSNNENKLDNKIKSILDAIKDEDTLDLSNEVSDPEIIRDFSNLLDKGDDDHDGLIGAKLGHWTIKELIGKGGMSVVFLAERNDEQLNQQVALKVLPQGLASNNLVSRFIRERQILSDLNHQNIAKLYDVGVTERGVPWFVMELIQGQTILEYAKSHELNIEQKIILFKQVCEALAYSHAQGVVHRDIKPGNLLVTNEGVVKLLDFGIASDDEQQSLTMTGAIMGTPGYMSPEQAKGLNDKIDRRSDIFSAGVLLYKLIKDDMPFKAESISEISYKIIHAEPTLLGNTISADIQAIIFMCLEKNVDKRYASFKQLLNDLNAYLNGDVVNARKITFLGRSIKKIKKNPVLSSVLLLALLATISGVAYGVYESIASVKKVQLTKEYMTAAEQIKNKIRRSHMMPLHNVQNDYAEYEKDIEELRINIEASGVDNTGMSDFALGTAYQNMRFYDKALKYFKLAESKGFESSEMYIGLGEAMAIEWDSQKKIANKIVDDDEYKVYLEEAKVKYYYPAKMYLEKAQKGSVHQHYLKSKIALVDNDLDTVIDEALLDIEQNPWHYEALKIASHAYSTKFLNLGSKQGYDAVYDLLDLSNELLEKAIEIGGSDPSNYVNRCTNVSIEMQVQKLSNYKHIEEAYEKGLKYCKAAILLYPEAVTPWTNISQLHVTYADYMLSMDKDSVEYNQKAVAVLNEGLKVFKDEYKLLILKVRPLINLAENAIEQSKDPMPLFQEALQATKRAEELDSKSYQPLFEQARINGAMSDYFLDEKNDIDLAEQYITDALNAYIKVDEIRNNFASILNLNYTRYNLAEIKYKQAKVEEAILLIAISVEERFKAIPQRNAYFGHFYSVLESQIGLIEMKIETKASIDSDVELGAKMVNVVCAFDGLLEKQNQQLVTLIKEFLGNNWIKKDEFNQCLNKIQ